MTYDNTDPSAYLRALWDEKDRSTNTKIENVKGIYVGTERDDDLALRLKRLITNAATRRDPRLPFTADNRAPGKGLVIVGDSGAGKSTLLQEAFKTNAAFPNYVNRGAWCPLVSIKAPSPCNLLQLAMRILGRLDYGTDRILKENVAWQRVRDQLRLQRILFLHIDDLQRVLHQLSDEEIQKVRDTLQDLMDSEDWPVQLILSGVPKLLPFARKERQFRRRLRFMYLSRLSAKDHSGFVEEAIKKYAHTGGLDLDLKPDDAVVGRLLHSAQYEMGTALEILGEAIELAFERSARSLTLNDFADAHAARCPMPDDQNVFLAYAWDTIDTNLLRQKDDEDDAAESEEAPQSRRRRR
jgi:type II secretory pathway predicted ATPase ExeA